MSFVPRPQEIYKHFKGNLYQIVAIAEHSETGEQLVVYQAMYGDFKTYARPLTMFISRVDREKYPDVKQEFRFALQGADAERQIRESAETEKSGRGQREPESGLGSGTQNDQTSQQTASAEIDPLVMEFLDADTYAQKLNILAALHYRITDRMINTMAVASDVEVEEGDLESRYNSLRKCLLMREKYECNRLR